MDFKLSIDCKKQKEALLNELKGGLFEYLTGQHIAQILDKEGVFLASIALEKKERLRFYEQWVRRHDRTLFYQLPILAQTQAKLLVDYLRPTDIIDIHLIGQKSNEATIQDFKEADLLIQSLSENIPISLKLCKDQSFVNTKSGGVRTFIAKYFKHYDNANTVQEELNILVDQCFQRMGHELYALDGMTFTGQYDECWDEQQLPHLPGQLSSEMRKIVLLSYHELILLLHEKIAKFSYDKERFKIALMPLLGIGHEKIVQGICFHGDGYQLKKSGIYDGSFFDKQLQHVEVHPVKPERSSFEIVLKDIVLQIRIKPMNKFTVPAHKINCSIQYGNKRG